MRLEEPQSRSTPGVKDEIQIMSFDRCATWITPQNNTTTTYYVLTTATKTLHFISFRIDLLEVSLQSPAGSRSEIIMRHTATSQFIGEEGF